MKRWELSILLALVLTIVLGQFTQFYATTKNIEQKTLRLHIVANSDSDEDQTVKLAVRDELLLQVGELFKEVDEKPTAQRIAKEQLQRIEQAAKKTLKENGFDYTVKAAVVNMYFMTTSYTDFTMPAGYYDAVRLELGLAKGKNWWCVLFPPLCIPSAQAPAAVDAMYDKDEQKVLKSGYDIRFKAVEIIEKVRRKE